MQYVLQRLSDFGCDTTYLQPFDTLYGFGPNVIGVKRGRLLPGVQLILLAHIDCIADPPNLAPGADDNASGVAALLEACRVLGSEWFNYTILFISQNAEEYTSGAAYYAMQARARGDSILGVLNLDMVGYALDGQDSVVALGKTVDPDCSALLNGFCFSAQEYTALKIRRIAVSIDTLHGYDHIYFWMFDYPALTITEAATTPCYHTQGDTIGPYHYGQCGVNDLPMCTEVARAAATTMAALAEVEGRPAVIEQPRVAQRGRIPVAVRRPCAAAVLFDAMGRRATTPKSGIYFARTASGLTGESTGFCKVVIVR